MVFVWVLALAGALDILGMIREGSHLFNESNTLWLTSLPLERNYTEQQSNASKLFAFSSPRRYGPARRCYKAQPPRGSRIESNHAYSFATSLLRPDRFPDPFATVHAWQRV